MKKDYYRITVWNVLSKEKAQALYEKIRTEQPEALVEPPQYQNFGKKI